MDARVDAGGDISGPRAIATTDDGRRSLKLVATFTGEGDGGPKAGALTVDKDMLTSTDGKTVGNG